MPTTLTILARLLELPTAGVKASLDLYADLLCEDEALSPDALAAVDRLLAELAQRDLAALRVEHFRTFRQSRETSLDLRGEIDDDVGASAERGRRLPSVLAALARAPEAEARRGLQALRGPLRRLARALAVRGSAHAGVTTALLELDRAAAPISAASPAPAPAPRAAGEVVQLVFEDARARPVRRPAARRRGRPDEAVS